MDQQKIQEMLFRYRQGRCTEAEAEKIRQWYDTLSHDSGLVLDEHDKNLLEHRMLKNIQGTMLTDNGVVDITPMRRWWRYSSLYAAVAAVVVISLTYTLFFNNRVQQLPTMEPLFVQAESGKLITHENTSGKEEKLLLEDKSVVTLSPGSRIVYPEKFADSQRDVQLTGNAFFEITKNPEKPFFVYSGKLITKVLGTSFRITTNKKDKALEVEVVTGKVSVFENNCAFNQDDPVENSVKNNNGVVLTPNQRVTYFPESRHLMTGLVVEPVKVQVTVAQPKLVFNDAQMLDIMASLQREYGIEIVLANDQLGKCTFTGDLSEMPLYEKLDLICKSNQANYEVKGTRILINGNGCD